MSVTTIVLGVIGIIAAIGVQFTARRVADRALWIMPLVLILVGSRGFNGALPELPGAGLVAIALIAINLAVAIGFGVARGASVRVWTDQGGTAWWKATRSTAILWGFSLVSRAMLAGFGQFAGVADHVELATLPLFFGITVGVQNAVVWFRAHPTLDGLLGHSGDTQRLQHS